jgi:hypothetical protein
LMKSQLMAPTAKESVSLWEESRYEISNQT